MNILHILTRFDSYDAIMGALDLSKHLSGNDCNCIVATSLSPQMLEMDRRGIRYYQLPSFETNIKNFFIAYNRLKEIIKVNKIGIVHTHSASTSWIAFLACRHTDRPLVTTCCDFYSNNIFNYALILSRKVIVHHHAVGKYLINNFNIPSERIQFIRQSLDLENFHFQGVDQRSKTDFDIGIASWLFPNRGYEYFLKAMVKVIRIIPHVKIQIFTSLAKSKYNVKEDLEFWAKRLGLSNYVRFIEVSDLNLKVLSGLNLLISTPIKENASTRVVLEAQAYGVPVIVTRVGGLAEAILTDKTGILVPPKDNDALSSSIIKILKNFQLSREITTAARNRIEEEFNLEKNLGDFIDTYQKAKNNLRVLVINVSKTKDVVSSIPALRLLRSQISHAQIMSLITPSLRCLLQRCPYVDELIVYDNNSKHKGLFGFIDIVKLLINNRFDVIFDFTNSFKTHLLSYLSLANKRYGYGRGISRFLINYNIKKPTESLGLVEDKLAILELFGIKLKDYKLELWPSQEDLEFAESFLKDSWVGKAKIAGIDIPFKKGFFKDFKTLDYLSYLCDKLASQHTRVILFGSKDDVNIKYELFKRIKFKPISVMRDISVIQLASLIKKCDIYISSNLDSLYIAIALNVPLIILSLAKNKLDFSSYKNIEILTAKDFQVDMKTGYKKIFLRQSRYKDLAMEKINKLMQIK